MSILPWGIFEECIRLEHIWVVSILYYSCVSVISDTTSEITHKISSYFLLPHFSIEISSENCEMSVVVYGCVTSL